MIEKVSKGEKLLERCWSISRKIRVTPYDNVTVAFYAWLVCPVASVTVKATVYGPVPAVLQKWRELMLERGLPFD